jgi:hypothetical protein
MVALVSTSDAKEGSPKRANAITAATATATIGRALDLLSSAGMRRRILMF